MPVHFLVRIRCQGSGGRVCFSRRVMWSYGLNPRKAFDIIMPQHLCTLCLFSCSQVLGASPLKGDATEERGDRISLFTRYTEFRLVIIR